MKQQLRGVYDVYYDDEDGIVERVRVTAEDEYDAEEKARALFYMPNGVRKVKYVEKA